MGVSYQGMGYDDFLNCISGIGRENAAIGFRILRVLALNQIFVSQCFIYQLSGQQVET